MSSFLKRRGIQPLILDKPSLDITWWEKYVEILSKYYNIFELVDANKNNILFEKCEEIILDDEPEYNAVGNSKNVEKCHYNGKIYASCSLNSVNGNINNEIKNHLDILFLYYETYDDAKWQFKIPKVYYRNSQKKNFN